MIQRIESIRLAPSNHPAVAVLIVESEILGIALVRCGMEGRNVDPRGAASQQARDRRGINGGKWRQKLKVVTYPSKKTLRYLDRSERGKKRTLVSKLKKRAAPRS
jgi:hypothetical protein